MMPNDDANDDRKLIKEKLCSTYFTVQFEL